jgi:hypothetical protein
VKHITYIVVARMGRVERDLHTFHLRYLATERAYALQDQAKRDGSRVEYAVIEREERVPQGRKSSC